MKFTVIGPTHPYKGGISHFTTILVRTLRKRNEVEFISWKRQYPGFLYPVEPKDTESKSPLTEEAIFLLDFINPITWIQTVLRIKKLKPTYLVITWINPVQGPLYFFICGLVRLFTKTKVIFICHNVLPHEPSFFDRPLTKLAYSQGDKFIVHSSEDKEDLQKLKNNANVDLGFMPVFNFYNQEKKYDVQKIKQELRLKKNVLIFFGYIRPYKGLKYLIQAMPDIIKKFPTTSLLVVGDFWSKDRQSYFDLVKNLSLTENIHFIDRYIPNEEIAKYFAAANVAIFPYLSATQSASILTAYSFNKPVIATKVGGLKDVVIDGKTGYAIEPANSKDISEKVIKFLGTKFPLDYLSEHNKKFSWDKYCDLLK